MIDLFSKASIIHVPIGYDIGSINSLKPTTSPYADLTFDRGSGGSVQSRFDGNGIIIFPDVETPRINYEGGDGYWLLEPSSTNMIAWSDQLSRTSDWIKMGLATVSNNQAIAPTGTLIADEVNSGHATALNGLRVDKSVTSGDDYTFSFFAKKKGTDTNYVAIRFESYNSAFLEKRAWFNIDSGALGTVESGITAKIEDYGNGWYRCSATQTATATAGSRVIMMLASDDGVSKLGVGLGIYGFGGQFEQSSFPTSYIPTEGIAESRDVETALNAGSTSLINSEEGVLYVEIASFEDDITDRRISLSDGTNNNRVNIIMKDDINIQMFTFDGSTLASKQVALTNKYGFNKIAVRYKANDHKLFINGVDHGTVDNNGSFTANTLTKLQLTRGNDTDDIFFGKIKCIAVFPEALTDSELQLLTT